MAKCWRIAILWGAILVLAAVQGIAVCADEPGTPTPTATAMPTDTQMAPAEESVTATPQATPAMSVAATVVPPTLPAATATPAPTPTAAATVGAAPVDTTYIALLVNEVVIPAGGRGTSEVFASLVAIQGGIQRFELHLSFDPQIVRVAGEDGPEIATAASLDVARVDNDRGEIVLVLSRPDETLLHRTTTWDKIATITWVAQRAGKSAITIDARTQFTTASGEVLSPDAISHGVVFVRSPGTMQGVVRLQGRADYGNVSVSGSLSSARFDRAATDKSGRFALTTSHGEGFYSLVAAMPGYLSAESDRPIKMTVDSVVDVGEITLYGGDVNGDNQVDIRDLSFVAWHFDAYDAKADINEDGQVDILDLTLTAGNFGRVGPTVWHVPDQGGG